MQLAPPPGPLLHPSIIELRYEKEDSYKEAVKLYSGLLHTRYEDSVGQVHTFRIGQSKERDYKDMLLRLTWEPSKLGANDGHTVIYWKIPGTESAELKQVDQALRDAHWAPLEEPAPYEVRPEPPAGGVAQRSLLRNDATGDVLGITINPPVPTIANDNPAFIRRLAALLSTLGFASDGGLRRALVAAVASGLVVAGLLFGLGWWWRGRLGR